MAMARSKLLDFSGDIMLSLVHFLSFDDAACLASAATSTLRSAEAASNFLEAATFKGIELFRLRPFKGALFQQLRECIEPQFLLAQNRCPSLGTACSLTAPMPIAVETSGRFYVLFKVVAGHATHGGPSVGVVDLDGARRHPIKLSHEDWSRPHQPSDFFGISCDPFAGRVHASHTSAVPLKHFDSLPLKEKCCPKSWSAEVLGWQSIGVAAGASLEIGMLISNGRLEFLRHGPCGWEHSGVVWDGLPEKVVPCAFLSTFVGAAVTYVERVRLHDFPSCNIAKHCDLRGDLSPWAIYPAAS